MKAKLNNYLYYIIIGIISILTVLVLPMIGSEAGLEVNLPDTVSGWIVYILMSVLTATANMMIFFSFMEQAKLNIKDDENYLKANQILIDLSLKKGKKNEKLPRSPKKWNLQEYGRKGTAIFIGSACSCFAISNAVLRFDVISLISYTVTVIFAIVFGVFQMKTAENYWTNEYFQYAKYEEKLFMEVQNDRSKQESLS